jgi:hypothetical protein
MAAARVANSLVGQEDPALTWSEGGETVMQVAHRCDVKSADLVKWNLARFPNITVNSRVQAGTAFFITDPGLVDTLTLEKAEMPKQVAKRLGISVDDLLQLNSEKHPDLTATTKLKPGATLIVRDRSSEPDVFLPTQKQERVLDDDGSLAEELQAQEHSGDPMTTGVVWPRIAELGLLAGLGAGKLLVRLALEELRASSEYDFVVLQATMASVSFYEELGFVRVGAIAKYHPEGTSIDQNPMQGYRHWACADESRVDEFGDTSYMMALKLQTMTPDHAVTKMLAKRLTSEWPAVDGAPSSARKKGKHGGSHHKSHNAAGILKPVGSSLQVGDMSLNVDEGDEARLQLRYEVEKILDSKGPHGSTQYLVKWKHLTVDDATWEKATSELMQSSAAKAALARFRKQPSGGSKRSHHGPSEGSSNAKHVEETSTRGAPSATPRWSHRIVRSLLHDQAPEPVLAGDRIFQGGLGEMPRMPNSALVEANPSHSLEREHRFWLVVRYAPISNKCTLVPLHAAGRFGGCGRRAGRIRWRPAPLKEGFERDAQASTLVAVMAEAVHGAREAEGEVWCIDELDVEQAAREQASSSRNKRRQLLDIELEPHLAASAPALGSGTRSGSVLRGMGGTSAATMMGLTFPPRRKPSTPRPPREPGSGPPRKKKRLAPASSSCLACTKGKHCAHTCGVRGKAAEAAAAAAAAVAAAAGESGAADESGDSGE